jgi:hypothetical protein
MSVEGSAAVIDTAPTPVSTPADADADLGAIWDRVERDNGAARENGKFASPNAAATTETTEPLEGGEGEAAAVAETSTPEAVEVPLPSNWRGLEDTWAKIPGELRESIKAHEDKLHQTLSQQGQALSAYKPIGDVIQKYGDYFDGRTAAYKPAEAVDYLFNLQRQMDANPINTLLEIADSYELRPKLAEMFGGQAGGGQQTDNNSVLLAEINQLKTIIRGMGDPSKIDERITSKLHEERQSKEVEDEISRVSKDMPLYAEIPETDLVHFINRSWAKLGETASREAVLKSAYDMAINADPDLRAKAAAVRTAAAGDPERVAAAKRANSTNIRSTSSGKGRELTDDELLGQVFDKNQRG